MHGQRTRTTKSRSLNSPRALLLCEPCEETSMVIEIRLDRDDVTTTKQSRKPCRTADDMSMREEKVSAATPQKWGNKSTGSGWRKQEDRGWEKQLYIGGPCEISESTRSRELPKPARHRVTSANTRLSVMLRSLRA